MIEAMVRSCNRDFAQNQGEKYSNTGSIASIFNDESAQNNIADACQGFNQRFLMGALIRKRDLINANVLCAVVVGVSVAEGISAKRIGRSLFCEAHRRKSFPRSDWAVGEAHFGIVGIELIELI